MTGRCSSRLVVSTSCLARPAAEVETILDNERMQVSESTFAPGFKTGEHSHPAGEATLVVAGGTMRYTLADGSAHTVELKTGDLRWRPEPETHTAENIGTTEIRLVTISLKGAADPRR